MDKIEYIKNNLSKPISLIGMMGAGKTFFGKMLSSELDLEFVDADDEIEKAASMSVAEIFDKFGEDYFRDGERRIIKRLLENNQGLISTGGGSVTNKETLSLLKKKSISIWLNADIDVIFERVKRNKKRPLLKVENPLAVIEDLLSKRTELYTQADITVRSDKYSTSEVIEDLVEKIYYFLRENKK